MYNNGNDYVGLEIVDGKLRLLVGKGSNAVELIPERNVSDGFWHNVSISYSPTKVEVSTEIQFRFDFRIKRNDFIRSVATRRLISNGKLCERQQSRDRTG